MKKNLVFLIVLLVAALLLSPTAALAQEPDPVLLMRLRRDFGYGGFDNSIQGRFSMRVDDADAFVRIDFYIDDERIASLTEAPFRTQFSTGSFASGEHRLYAIGYTANGEEVRSNELVRVFLSSNQVRDRVVDLIIPLVVVIALIALLSAYLPRLIWRDKAHVLGQYGVVGGAVCKQCNKPFSRHAWAPNLFVGKLEKCPHCGKWQVAARATPAALEAAEELLRDGGSSIARSSKTESPEEQLKRQIDDSRFND